MPKIKEALPNGESLFIMDGSEITVFFQKNEEEIKID